MESFESFDQRMSTQEADALDLLYRPQMNETEPQFVPTGMNIDGQDVAPITHMRCFRLSDEKAVRGYLLNRLLLLQQQASKRIAKLWIKGICPKKQARYPYKSKQQKENQDAKPHVPEWWPLDLCRFTEPDHIDKTSRMNLCLHLLRLRPSLRQLKEWNEDLQGPNKTLETRGWTAFLQELTPSTTLDGLGKSPESEERVKQRQMIMNDMYDIAEKEEAFIKGERDDDVIYYEENEDASTVSTKKPHIRKQATDDQESKGSDTVGRRPKRSKHAAAPESPKRKRGLAKTGKIGTVKNRASAGRGSLSLSVSIAKCKPLKPSRMESMQDMGHLTAEYHPELMAHWASMHQSTGEQESSPMASSSSSSHSSQDDMSGSFQFFDAPTEFPGQQDFKFEDPAHQYDAFNVRNVEIPQPYSEAVPNTPIISPSKFEPFPQGNVWSEGYHVAPIMERYPDHVATTYMSAVTAPVLASQPPMLASNMAYTQGPFIEQHDRRPITPASDSQPTYEGIPTIEYGEHQHHDGQPLPIGYPEATPEADFPAAALPGSVTRGFTGTSSGVSGGAWT